ncbi:MAG: YfhO family protein, partial [Eubacteriales bacterium]
DVYYGYYPKESYHSFMSVNNDALTMAGNNTRIEKTYYRYLNDSMALGYRGLTHYSSMYRRSFIAVMRSLGYAASEYWSSYFGSTPVLDSLFGIDYLLDMTDTDYASRMYIKRTGLSYASDLYEKTGSTHLIDIYRNPYSLQVAYEVDDGFASAVIDGINPFERQNSFVSAMTGKKETLFTAEKVLEPIFKEMNSEESNNSTVEKYALYSFTVSQDGTLYMYIHSDTHTPCRIYVNDIHYANYQTSQAAIAYSVYLGSYKSGDAVKVRLEPIGTELNFTSADFYTLTEDYSSVINSLHSGAAEVSSLDGNRINIKAKQSGLLFTSIPYEEGWRVMNEDGISPAKLLEISGFLCVDPNDGINNVKLVYIPPGLWRGCILTAEGLLLLFCILAKEKKVK